MKVLLVAFCPSIVRTSFKLFSTATCSLAEKTRSDYVSFSAATFYHFFPSPLPDVEALVEDTRQLLQSENVLGTVIIAKEGLNGQLTLQTNKISEIQTQFQQVHPLFSNIEFNIGRSFVKELDTVKFPHKKLVVREKKQALTDGLSCPLDWTDNGPELSPQDWHHELLQVQQNPEGATDGTGTTILLDCRNGYESEKGTFRGAIPLKTNAFSDSWKVLDNLLQDVPKNTRVLTFCTGGIRCEKVNAYLKQRLHLTNIGRLQDGIVAYERWTKQKQLADNNKAEQAEQSDCSGDQQDNCLSNNNNGSGSDDQKGSTKSNSVGDSLFIGENFVFDRSRFMLSTDN